MAQRGYIIVTDLTGYTAFLSQSELEHAEEILSELMEAVLEHTRPPLIISRLEGDAVICHAPTEAFLRGQTLVESLEHTYVAFRQTRDRARLNTTCQCNACLNISNLDLKFFVHMGTYKLQTIGTFTDLLGTDVNLVFRLTKNSIPDKTGLRAYAAYTQAAINRLGIAGLAEAWLPHSESYEYIGRVDVHVQAMHPVWERKQYLHQVIVEPDDALVTMEIDFPVEPALAWDILTDPEYRKTLYGSDSQELMNLDAGRAAAGPTYHCYHGDVTGEQTIVDWHPFRYYTFRSLNPDVPVTNNTTIALVPIDSGTRVSIRISPSEGSFLNRRRGDQMLRKGLQSIMPTLLGNVLQRVNQGVASGTLAPAGAGDGAQHDVEAAVRETLAAARG